MRRGSFIYAASLALTLAGAGLILRSGKPLEARRALTLREAPSPAPTQAPAHPLGLFLAQALLITLLARLLGRAARRLGQPAVIGEIVAGLALGPSLLGSAWPEVQARLFPPDSMGALRLLSQLGVLLFMFVVGIDLDLGHLRRRGKTAVMVSHVSIMLPFLLGMVLALPLYPSYAAGTSFEPFALFMGIALSVTAFPVLARILAERGMTRTPLGATALACAAIDDATAWSLLALVTALASSGSPLEAARTVGLSLAFIAAVLGVLRPALARSPAGALAREGAWVPVALALCGGLATELIGIHALFGAFLVGTALPADQTLRRTLRERLETISAVLLPLFFAFTGLRTRVGSLQDGAGWLVCLAVTATAVAGKLGGGAAAARLSGLGWGDSLALGALMNTRGLVELIVLNIGYDLGILSEAMFAMLVLMALATTMMTGPLLAWIDSGRRAGLLEPEAESAPSP